GRTKEAAGQGGPARSLGEGSRAIGSRRRSKGSEHGRIFTHGDTGEATQGRGGDGLMKFEELKKAKDRRPFEPFEVRMADGRSLPIKHPDALAWDPDQTRIAICGLPGGAWEVIDVALVTALGIPAPAQPKAGGNGE